MVLWQLDLGVSHMISKLPTLLSVETGRGTCGRRDSSCRKMWWVSGHQHRGWEGFLGIALVLESLILTLECGFGTNRMSAYCGVPFSRLADSCSDSPQAKRKPLDIGKQKVWFRCVFSKWLVPITFGFLTIRVSSSSHFWVSFWSLCLPGFMWKLAQKHLTISLSSPKPFAHVGSVAGNRHPQEVWWRPLHHWQVPQGRLLLFDLKSRWWQSIIYSLQSLLPNHLQPIGVFIDFGRDYLDQSLPSTIGSGSTTFLYHAGPHGWEMDQCIRCREALRVGMLNAVDAWWMQQNNEPIWANNEIWFNRW